jgi:SAF domain
MNGYDEPGRSGRFGAATPGARPSPPSLEALLEAPSTPPRRWWRRPWMIALAAVVLLAGGFAAGHYIGRRPAPAPPSELMVTDTALPAGTRLTAADLRTVPVQAGARLPAGAVTPAAAGPMIGHVMARAVPAGTFLTSALMTSGGALPGPAHALVGLSLKPGQLPSGGLSVGQQVLIVLLHASSDGTVLHPSPLVITTVWYIQAADSSGDTQASVIVSVHLAGLLSGYAAQQDVALVSTDIPQSHAPAASPTSTPTPAKSTPAKSSRRPAASHSPTPSRSSRPPAKSRKPGSKAT